jgi:hypothetical protein
MKTIAYVRFAAVALLASAPVFAQAAESDSVQRCMDVFATTSFADRATSFKIERTYAPLLPLIYRSGTNRVQLVASDLASGRIIATAHCSIRQGVTTVGEVSTSELIAVR